MSELKKDTDFTTNKTWKIKALHSIPVCLSQNKPDVTKTLKASLELASQLDIVSPPSKSNFKSYSHDLWENYLKNEPITFFKMTAFSHFVLIGFFPKATQIGGNE